MLTSSIAALEGNTMINTYKFRAECIHDVHLFFQLFQVWTEFRVTALLFPDVECEFKSALSLADLKAIMTAIPDGHVMLETIQTADQYDGERRP